VTLEEAVAARHSVRAFDGRPVPRSVVLRAIELAVQAPAPHHSAPWRFVLLDEPGEKEALSTAMAEAWRRDLEADGLPRTKIQSILARSHELLTGAPLLTVCCADLTRAHKYPDERRRLAEWSLFAHTVGAALQTYMLSLTSDGVASCWLSAPVFCRPVVRDHLGLESAIEPQALVLVGYASPDYSPRRRLTPDAVSYLLSPGTLVRREQEVGGEAAAPPGGGTQTSGDAARGS
jgi:coenzyme F420-0:L-glutamate ligase/coenzyme F420-1:gamma-L-glutamate ligase